MAKEATFGINTSFNECGASPDEGRYVQRPAAWKWANKIPARKKQYKVEDITGLTMKRSWRCCRTPMSKTS
jgi:hypothetical protein